MKKFLENMISISVYAWVFCVFICIGGWKLETREIIAICLILVSSLARLTTSNVYCVNCLTRKKTDDD